jgi:hypothetical protein
MALSANSRVNGLANWFKTEIKSFPQIGKDADLTVRKVSTVISTVRPFALHSTNDSTFSTILQLVLCHYVEVVGFTGQELGCRS